jgi:DNA-binding HxlR family transcriptional regulator
MEMLGRRWTGVILLAMHGGLERFTSIRDAIPGLSDRLLSERLVELEAAGVVERVTTEGHVYYRLSPKGEALRPVITAVAEWTEAHQVSGQETVSALALGRA